MKLMTTEQRKTLLDTVGNRLALAATPETATAAARDAYTAYKHGPHTDRGTHAMRQILPATLPILRRLLEVEEQLAATRGAIARHVAASDAGDDPAPADLLADLDCVEAPLDADDLEHARALHNATAVMW